MKKFKGIDPSSFENEDLSKKRPKMNMTFVDITGEVSIVFDRDMVYPNVINQEFYNEVLRFKYVSSSNSDLTSIGRFEDFTQSSKRRAQTNQNNTDKFKFSLKVIKHDGQEVKIKMKFDHPEEISNSEFDELQVEILQPEVFISSQNGMTVEFDHVKQNQA